MPKKISLEQRLELVKQAAKLISARKELELTQQEVTDETGIKQHQISRIESGKESENLQALKRYYISKGLPDNYFEQEDNSELRMELNEMKNRLLEHEKIINILKRLIDS